MLASWRKSYDEPRQCTEKQRHHFANKICVVTTMVFSAVMYGCESWTINKAECRRIDAFKLVLAKTLESPLDSKEIKSVNPKGNQLWIFIGRADAKAEDPIIWPRIMKGWLIGKDWRQDEKGMTREWDGWMASLTQWTWVWTSSRHWCWTVKPLMLQSMGSQGVGL